MSGACDFMHLRLHDGHRSAVADPSSTNTARRVWRSGQSVTTPTQKHLGVEFISELYLNVPQMGTHRGEGEDESYLLPPVNY